MLKTIILAAAAIAAASPAAAADAGDPFRVAIPVAGLDLDSAEGRAELARRTRAIAETTCAPKPFPNVYETASLRQCLATFSYAMRQAIAERRLANATR